MPDLPSQTDQATMTTRSPGPSLVGPDLGGSTDLRGAFEGSTNADGVAPVTVLLRLAAATVDRWSSEARGVDGDLSMRLGEASHAIHRAMLALEDPTAS